MHVSGLLRDGRKAVEKLQVLQEINFGERIAEDEIEQLRSYFVETDEWQRIFAGDIDIVYGSKGAGKSAIYSLLLERKQELSKRRIIAFAAESPRGIPVFKSLINDTDITEQELYNLWKLYFLALVAEQFRKENISGSQANKVIRALEEANLLRREEFSLGRVLRSVVDYVHLWFHPQAVEGGLQIDSTTGAPSFTGKITLREPDSAQRDLGMISADELLRLANAALEHSRLSVWVLLDRLDIAFSESRVLESKALRALFKTYLDLQMLNHISLKIFLRNDIWQSITNDEGFRGASHIIRELTISWNQDSLRNLVIRRALNNPVLRDFYKVSRSEILASTQKQSDLCDRIFSRVDSRQSISTFNWILSRITDASGKTAPRELIHLLSSARTHQLQKLRVGNDDPPAEALFDVITLKAALRDVSQTRYEKTLCAEFPGLKNWLDKLEGQKTLQTPDSLTTLWAVSRDQALEIANSLFEVGFFEKRSTQGGELTFWVPFLYRDALRMIRGSAR